MSYPIVEVLLPGPSKRRPGLKINQVRFLVAHDTGNPGSTARQNVMYYARTVEKESASAHIFVDDREIIECIPTGLSWRPAEKAWHVHYDRPEDNRLFGDDANDVAIGVEYCFGDNINADQAYARYVWVLAELCRKFSLSHTAIVGHYFLDPARRTDPVTGLARSRRTWDQLLRDVHAELVGLEPAPVPLAQPVRLVATARLNLRGAPSTRAPIVGTVVPGAELLAVTSAEAELVNGVDDWWGDAQGRWWWGGGVKAA